MNSQPELKSSELITKLTDLQDNLNDFALKSIEREAQVLMKSNARDAHMIIGIISGLKGDYKRCVNSYSIAINIRDNDTIRNNYALSLLKLGQASASLEQISLALDYSQDNVDMYREAVEIAFLAGFPKKALEFNQSLEKFHAESNDHTKRIVSDSTQLLSMEIPEDYLQDLFSIVEQLTLDSNVTIESREYHLDLPEQSALCWIQTALDPKGVLELNIKFCKILEEKNIDISLFSKFNVLFRAAA